MLRPLWQFLRLDRRRQRLFLQAWWVLGSTRMALRSRSFKQLIEPMKRRQLVFEPTPPGAEALAEARRIGWAVQAASRYAPWKCTCLVQVLAAQRMLEQRLLPGAIYIGAAPGEGEGVGLDAHAWLKCGNAVLCGERGHERYQVVMALSWL